MYVISVRMCKYYGDLIVLYRPVFGIKNLFAYFVRLLEKCLIFLVTALISFRKINNRERSISTKVEDIESLKKIINEILELYQSRNQTKLDDHIFEVLLDQFVPVCAILGGFIAQQIIKAVSHKNIPVHNVFLFNPLNYRGIQETVGRYIIIKSIKGSR